VKIRSVTANNRRRVFEIETRTRSYVFPYSAVEPRPWKGDLLRHVHVDEELGREGFTYVLASGAEGSVHIDSVLEYNEDPSFVRDLLVYRLTVEARRCVHSSGLTKREIIRRARTSPAQFYRLLDLSNSGKSLDKLVTLLRAVDCEVDFSVRRVEPGKPRPGAASGRHKTRDKD
jgi:hypothetical protein